MFKRIDQSEWDDYICEDLQAVLVLLTADCGVKIRAVGLENVKAPETVIKLEGGMQGSFVEILTKEFSLNANLNISENWVACREHFCMIE